MCDKEFKELVKIAVEKLKDESVTVVAAEMVRSSGGVGWVIVKGQDSNGTVQILVGIVAIGIVGYILAVAMRAIEARLCRWSVRGK